MSLIDYASDERTALELSGKLFEESKAFLKGLLKEQPRLASRKAKPPIRAISSAFITVLVIGLLLMSGPAYAFTSTIEVDNDKPTPGETTTFTVKITKVSNEVINTIELKVKDPDGNTTNATKQSCNPDYAGDANAYGYGYTSGYGSTNSGYGYGYGYGYANDSAGAITCTFEYTPTIAGNYSAQVYVNDKAIGTETQNVIVATEGSVSNPIEGTTYVPTDNTKLKFTTLPAGSHDVNIAESTSTPTGTNTTGFSVAGTFFEIKSDMANSTFSVDLTFSYPDVAPSDDIVDGTSINENNLDVYYWNGSNWATIPNPTIDPVANTITVTVDHFTWFTLMQANAATPAPAPATGGGGGWSGGGARIATTTPVPTPTPEPTPETPVQTPGTETPTPTPVPTGPQGVAAEPTAPTLGVGLFGLAPLAGNSLTIVLAVLGIASFGYFCNAKLRQKK